LLCFVIIAVAPNRWLQRQKIENAPLRQ